MSTRNSRLEVLRSITGGEFGKTTDFLQLAGSLLKYALRRQHYDVKVALDPPPIGALATLVAGFNETSAKRIHSSEVRNKRYRSLIGTSSTPNLSKAQQRFQKAADLFTDRLSELQDAGTQDHADLARFIEIVRRDYLSKK